MKRLLLIAALLIVACESPLQQEPEEWPQGSLVETDKIGGPQLDYGFDGLVFWYQPEFQIPVDAGTGGKAGAKQYHEKYKDIWGNEYENWYYQVNGHRNYVTCLINGRLVSCED